MDVLLEKGFAATSVQDVTEQANVNRGTFYIHFADKYELLDAVMREQFQQQLASRLPPDSRWDRQSLRLLIHAVLDNFERKYRHQRLSPILAEVAPLLERAVHDELSELLMMWLKQAGYPATQRSVPLETITRVVSWAIFGAALQWSQEPATVSSEQMASDMLLVILEGVVHLAPELLPE